MPDDKSRHLGMWWVKRDEAAGGACLLIAGCLGWNVATQGMAQLKRTFQPGERLLMRPAVPLVAARAPFMALPWFPLVPMGSSRFPLKQPDHPGSDEAGRLLVSAPGA